MLDTGKFPGSAAENICYRIFLLYIEQERQLVSAADGHAEDFGLNTACTNDLWILMCFK